MRGPSDNPFDLAAIAAGAPISRRRALLAAASVFAASAMSSWPFQPTTARAGVVGIVGYCAAVDPGTCDNNNVLGPWDETCPDAGQIPTGNAAGYNGCGPIKGFDIGQFKGVEVPDSPLWLADFTYACNFHDCCYGTCGRAKSDCDRIFLDLMLTACNSPSSLSGVFGGIAQAYCNTIAVMYYEAVATLGASPYADGQKESCACCQCGDGPPCQVPQTCCPPGQCVDTNTDPENCGGCGVVCPNGGACIDGSCPCPGGQFCGDQCVDTQSDPSNCGGCGYVCPTGSSCENAGCAPDQNGPGTPGNPTPGNGYCIWCPCNESYYANEDDCLANCNLTLGCFAGYCSPVC